MGWAILGSFLNFRPFQGHVTFCCSQSRVFSWAIIVAPAMPSFSLEPVCSGCQCVLNNVRTGPLFGSEATACASAPEFCASPPSTITAPSAPVRAITFPPAPLSRYRLSPNCVVVMLGACAKAHGATRPAAAAFINVLRVETNILSADIVYSREIRKTPPYQAGLTAAVVPEPVQREHEHHHRRVVDLRSFGPTVAAGRPKPP